MPRRGHTQRVGEAPAGPELLHRLRGGDGPRLPGDPALASALRAWLEEAVADPVAHLPEGVVVRVSKGAISSVLRCEAGHVAGLVQRRDAPQPSNAALLLGRLSDHLFALVALGGGIGSDVLETCLRAAEADGDGTDDPRADLAALDPDEQAGLQAALEGIALDLAARWPSLPAGAWPRIQERVAVPLAGGRVLLTGRLDLVLGGPRPDAAGGAVIDVKSGGMRLDDRQDAAFYALAETLRQRVPPAVAGTYYLRTGEADLDPVTEVFLESGVRRTAEAASRLVALAAGAAPTVTPNGLCPYCPAFEACPSGQRHVAQRDGADEAWDAETSDADLGAGDDDDPGDDRDLDPWNGGG